jgi:hypothetical protein
MGKIRSILRWRAVVALLSLVLSGFNAWAKDGRIALVFGNGVYINVTPLKNAVTDAEAVATNLEALGFDVTKATNATRGQMNEAIGAFLEKAGPATDAVIYFAGHGVELAGANYLLPVDVPGLRPGQERLLRAESISLTDLLTELEGRQSRVSVVVLDACRDNPFPPQGTRSLGSTRGLARVDPPAGAFVVFSAGAGEQALDVLGPDDPDPNGVFTRRFLALMNEQGLELRQMVLRLRGDVTRLANGVSHKQTPSYYDQMTGSFFFKPGQPGQTPTADNPAPPPQQTAAIAPVAPQTRGRVVDLRPGPFVIGPKHNGKPLAWCMTRGKDCGFSVADAFCRKEGSAAARSIGATSAKETSFLGGGPDCSGLGCQAISRIHCLPPEGMRKVPQGYEALLTERQQLNTDCKATTFADVTITRQPEGGEIVTRQEMTTMIAAGGATAHCNGKQAPGIRVFFKPKPGFVGTTLVEFATSSGGLAELKFRLNIEVLP